MSRCPKPEATEALNPALSPQPQTLNPKTLTADSAFCQDGEEHQLRHFLRLCGGLQLDLPRHRELEGPVAYTGLWGSGFGLRV